MCNIKRQCSDWSFKISFEIIIEKSALVGRMARQDIDQKQCWAITVTLYGANKDQTLPDLVYLVKYIILFLYFSTMKYHRPFALKQDNNLKAVVTFLRHFNSMLPKSCLTITYISVIRSCWHFARRTAVSLPCAVQKIKTIGQLKLLFWTSKILRYVFSGEYPILQKALGKHM